ncbi:MAG: glycoside hydrolase family 12 [Actinomycetia bacterium]|nr:glycoside hydrolase family 12 [Actinomycetes bacterium]
MRLASRHGPGRIANRRGWRRSIAAILTVVCMAAAPAACGQANEAGGRVTLLPQTAAGGNVWDWTSQCRVGPHRQIGCYAAGPNVGSAQLAGNEWNLGGTENAGSVSMSIDSAGALQVKGKLSTTPPCTAADCVAPQANTWVRGFPSVLYGIDQCNAGTSPQQSPKLRLPARVDSISPNLIGTTTYNPKTPEVTYDIAYDMWLNPSGTTSPCQTDGTVEVMVWTDHNAQSLLPAGLTAGIATVPYSVNGAAKSGDRAWTVYATNVYGNGHTVPWGGTVWVVLDAAHTVKRGTVSVDLSAALDAVGTVLQRNYGWSDFGSSHWLDTIAFGAEFGPQNADPYGNGPTDFSLHLTSYCLEVGTKVSAAGC